MLFHIHFNFRIMIVKAHLMALLLLLLIATVTSASKYKVTDKSQNSTSVRLSLQYTGTDQFYGKASSSIIKKLAFIFHVHTYNNFFFKIIDAEKNRFQVPQYPPFPVDPRTNFSFPIFNSAVNFQYTENPFDFKIIRKSNGAVLFSTHGRDIIYSDKYLEISTEISSDYVYGLGERFEQSFRKRDGKWTIFNRDRGMHIDKGTGVQSYGYYPFYLLREPLNYFHICYFRSSNAMDVIKSTQDGTHYLTYKVIGGVLDFRYFLQDQDPELATVSLQQYSQHAAIPPFWSLGFHQCRYGYPSANDLLDVLANFEKHSIPLDTIWSDIFYMVDYEDFTINEAKFPLNLMKNITDRYRFVPIIDAGIKYDGQAYKEGIKRQVFINDASGEGPYFGKVWPGKTAFVDFFHPNASQYWQDMLDVLYQKVKFSGIWLDMNEPANFCKGVCWPSTGGKTAFDYSKDLPYYPGSDNIEEHTISLNATHYGGSVEADVHVFFGLMETYATYQFLKNKGMRPFILTRSSTFGSSKYGFHWPGDSYSTWQFLRGSIADMFNGQMFGFQMVGGDICGFGGSTNEELCARWFQLGSLYTFARDHSDLNTKSQEPYALGQTVLLAAKTNLQLRYSLLKYMYSMIVDSRGLGTIWRPLFFQFPKDDNAYDDEVVDTQFMIGRDLMCAPILTQGTKDRWVYFPETNWTNLETGQGYIPGTHLIQQIKLTRQVPLFIREGGIIITQDTENVVNTKQLDNKFLLTISLAYNPLQSNSTTMVYDATSRSILSIKNYHDDARVTECYNKGCSYVFTAWVHISEKQRYLTLSCSYKGSKLLAEEIFIIGTNLAFGNEVAVIQFEQPLKFIERGTYHVPIPVSKNKNKRWISLHDVGRNLQQN